MAKFVRQRAALFDGVQAGRKQYEVVFGKPAAGFASFEPADVVNINPHTEPAGHVE
nr:hypothetical protein [Corynebacterium coyleae]